MELQRANLFPVLCAGVEQQEARLSGAARAAAIDYFSNRVFCLISPMNHESYSRHVALRCRSFDFEFFAIQAKRAKHRVRLRGPNRNEDSKTNRFSNRILGFFALALRPPLVLVLSSSVICLGGGGWHEPAPVPALPPLRLSQKRPLFSASVSGAAFFSVTPLSLSPLSSRSRL